MKITGSERETLSVIASCPFVDRLELAAISGASRSAVYEAVRGLEDGGLVAHVPHAADLIPPTRRYRLTARGLGALAEAEGSTAVSSTGQALDDPLRSRPVSIQWLRILMDRLDALAVIYRLASTIAGVAHPVGLRLYRASPLDAAMTLPGGRTVGIARQAGTRRRQDGLLTAALEAVRRAAPRNGPRAGHRRGAVETRPQDAAPHRGGAAGPGTGRGPRRTRGRGVAPRLLRSPREPPQRPGTAGSRGRAARGGPPLAGGLARRRRPGRRPRSARPSQTRREARPRPDLRLALAAPHGAGEPDGRLRAPRVPARQRPRRVRPRDPAHRRERTNRPHRPGRGAPGP